MSWNRWATSLAGLVASVLAISSCGDDTAADGPRLVMSGTDAGTRWDLLIDEDRPGGSGAALCVQTEHLAEPSCSIGLGDISEPPSRSPLSFTRFYLGEGHEGIETVAGAVSREVRELEVRFSDGSTRGIPIAWIADRPLGLYFGVFEADPAGGLRVLSVAALDAQGRVLAERP